MASISLGVSGSVSAGDTTTVSWNSGSNAATKYINSTGINAYPRVTPKAQSVGTGSLSGGEYVGSFTATFQEPVTNAGVAVSNHSVNYTLRTGNTGGTILATSGSVQVYRTPLAPTGLALESRTTTSITMRASGGGSFGVLQIKLGSGSYQTADSNGDVTFTGLSAGTSYTFTARRLNVVNFSDPFFDRTATVSTLSATPVAPSVDPICSIIQNGFSLRSRPSGGNGTFAYRWSTTDRGGFDTGYTSAEDLGVGVEWVGTTWTVRSRASVSGQSDVFGTATNLNVHSYSVSGPSTIQEGTTGQFTITKTAGTVSYQLSPSSDFAVSSGIAGSTQNVTPTADNITEGTENATIKLYINNTFNSLNEVASASFTITDQAPTITAPTVSSVTFGSDESATTSATVNSTGGSGGTLLHAMTTSASAPSANSSAWQSSNTFTTVDFLSITRGTTYYGWARRSTTAVSSGVAATAPYLSAIADSTITLGSLNPSSPIDSNVTTVTLPYSGGSNADQYRVFSTSSGSIWADTQNGASGTFTLTGNDLPTTAGTTYTYFLEGRRMASGGGTPNGAWQSVNSGATFTIKRQSDFGGTGTGGGTANDYGLKITNQAGTSTIIDDTSRIGAIIASESHTFSGPGTQSDTMFQGFDCSSKSETGLVVRWTGTAWLTPIPSRSTNGVTFTKIGTTLSGNGTLFVNLIRY